jgi:hypothetical protein
MCNEKNGPCKGHTTTNLTTARPQDHKTSWPECLAVPKSTLGHVYSTAQTTTNICCASTRQRSVLDWLMVEMSCRLTAGGQSLLCRAITTTRQALLLNGRWLWTRARQMWLTESIDDKLDPRFDSTQNNRMCKTRQDAERQRGDRS